MTFYELNRYQVMSQAETLSTILPNNRLSLGRLAPIKIFQVNVFSIKIFPRILICHGRFLMILSDHLNKIDYFCILYHQIFVSWIKLFQSNQLNRFLISNFEETTISSDAENFYRSKNLGFSRNLLDIYRFTPFVIKLSYTSA